MTGIITLWYYVLVNVDGNEIKVKNLCLGLIFIFLGVKFYKRIFFKVDKYIHKLDKNRNKDLVESLSSIFNITITTLYSIFVLNILNIPLSSLAYIGGALAFGIGLGLRGIVSDFISSVIIILDKPFGIGDIIKVRDIKGVIQNIGPRRIILKTEDNTDVRIPNSKALEDILTIFKKGSIIQLKTTVKIPKIYENHLDVMKKIKNIVQENPYFIKSCKPEVQLCSIGSIFYVFDILYHDRINNSNNITKIKYYLSDNILRKFKEHTVEVEHK